MIGVAAFFAFVAAVFFFALATFTLALDGVPEIAAGLLCLSIGLLLERVAGVYKETVKVVPRLVQRRQSE